MSHNATVELKSFSVGVAGIDINLLKDILNLFDLLIKEFILILIKWCVLLYHQDIKFHNSLSFITFELIYVLTLFTVSTLQI